MVHRTAGLRRSLAFLAFAAGASLSLPALAQDNQSAPRGLETLTPAPPQTQPANPPIQIFTPGEPAQQAPVTPPPVVRTVPAAPAPRPAATTESDPPTRSAPEAASSAPVTAAPAETPAAAPDDAAPVGNVTAPAPGFDAAPAPAPVAVAEEDTVDPATTTGARWGVWPFVAIALLFSAIAVAIALARRRRRARDAATWEDDRAIVLGNEIAPQPVAPPVADAVALAETEAAPIDAVEADAVEAVVETVEMAAEPADVDALAAAPVPSDDRPWLEFSLRPVRAGTNVVDAMVEFELTVGNAGEVGADNVRVAAWLLSASPNQDEDIARFLAAPPSDAVMPAFAIAAGEGRRVDAAISLPKSGLNVVTARDRPFFVPMVVADARYELPGGGEGRTSAAFVVGTVKAQGDKLGPIWLDRGPRMHEDIEARLHGDPVRE